MTEKENKVKASASMEKTIEDLTKEVGELRSKNKRCLSHEGVGRW